MRRFTIHDPTNEIMIIKFKHGLDKKTIWEERPWSIKGFPFVLKEWSPNIPVSLLNFNKCNFWMHILDLPINCMNFRTGRRLAEATRTPLDEDRENKHQLGRFMRIQVEVDITSQNR
uniref:DUF4283 domain-containing protein n=1 Tax=Nelumbo nucifera TaxID=4432 RepID=A0A822ZCW4_NELNU|nr:TPA_asm: hypothetical protein HUJ06_015588 [Nelumbo nucifera]